MWWRFLKSTLPFSSRRAINTSRINPASLWKRRPDLSTLFLWDAVFTKSLSRQFLLQRSSSCLGPSWWNFFMFQVGKCTEFNSHGASDGSLQLHIFKTCFQWKGLLVNDFCCSTHPGSWTEGQKKCGAISCTLGLSYYHTAHNAEKVPVHNKSSWW